MNNFLKEYKVDRVETFKFVILTIFTYGMYSTYWLGKLNKNFNQNFKTIQLILNKHFKITIFKNYILINNKDLEDIIKIIESQYLKYKIIK